MAGGKTIKGQNDSGRHYCTMRSLLATFALPRTFISHNRTSLVSTEILKFNRDNGISSITSAPYHPVNNGQAELYVAEIKRALAIDQTGSTDLRVAHFLFIQQNTVLSSTEETLATVMFGQEMRTQLTGIAPESLPKILFEKEKLSHSRGI